MSVHGSYDILLVTLSVAVAIFASFTALNLAGRLLAADKAARRWWLVAASLALGGGIWSMHFVGMLAFSMPMPATYDVHLTLLSLALPILVTGAGLHALSRFGNGWRPLLAAGLLAGLGIVVMHYTGMAAMRMPGVSIGYDPVLVGISIGIAIVAATAAFWLAFRTQATWERLVAAVVMGLAIAGMHYTAMAAASFTVDDHQALHMAPVIEPAVLAIAVVSATSILLLLALVTAFFDRKLATLTAREAAALKQSEERHRALIRNASDIVAILDRDGSFIYEGSSAAHVLGYRTDDLTGRPLTHFVQAEQVASVSGHLASLQERPEAQARFELDARHTDGTWRTFEVIAKNLLDEPAIGGIVVNLRDITERRLLMAALEKLSETDPLTGASNRRGFLKLAEREFARLERTMQPLTVIMIDIDHFKQVNDTYGHAAGDLVLARVAEECRAHIRASDLLARFGGEEFIVLMADGAADDPQEIVERLRRAIAAARVPTIKGEVAVTASFGIATVETAATDLETAIRLADEALYEAKNAGRNCIKVRVAAAC
jgi:diguanylate cyclase (GGDEF)-like protein/PAS domain S-box-containing protein